MFIFPYSIVFLNWKIRINYHGFLHQDNNSIFRCLLSIFGIFVDFIYLLLQQSSCYFFILNPFTHHLSPPTKTHTVYWEQRACFATFYFVASFQFYTTTITTFLLINFMIYIEWFYLERKIHEASVVLSVTWETIYVVL